MLPWLKLPLNRTILVLFALAYALPGLIGHDPWKPWDVVSADIAHNMLRTGDWIVPRVAGDPQFDYPPLYYWLASAMGAMFSWALPFHDAIRLISGALVLACLALLSPAARAWASEEDPDGPVSIAILLLVGSVGLITHAHDATPALTGLAATAAALAALSHAPYRTGVSGVAFGAAVGLAFLGTGVAVPAALVITALLAPAVCPDWRRPWALRFFATAIPVALLCVLPWTIALLGRSAPLFTDWWWEATQPRGSIVVNLGELLGMASWFAWPAWPFALWSVWIQRRYVLEPRVIIPLLATTTLLVCLAFMGSSHEARAAALLPPLALLGAQGVRQLRRGAAAAFDWFGIMTFLLFVSFAWIGYIAAILGIPAQMAGNATRLAPGFEAVFRPLPFMIAAALTAGWLYVLLRTPRTPSRGIARWAAGIVALWGTLAMLWTPWSEYQRSYRTAAQELKALIPPGTSCLAGKSVGVAQRAALDYHVGLRMTRHDPIRPEACPLVLVQGQPSHEFDQPGPRWKKIAEVSRPGDRNERFRLYSLVR